MLEVAVSLRLVGWGSGSVGWGSLLLGLGRQVVRRKKEPRPGWPGRPRSPPPCCCCLLTCCDDSQRCGWCGGAILQKRSPTSLRHPQSQFPPVQVASGQGSV